MRRMSRLQFATLGLIILNLGCDFKQSAPMMSVSTHFRPCVEPHSASLEAFLPEGLYIVSVFVFCRSEVESTPDPVDVKVYVVEDGVLTSAFLSVFDLETERHQRPGSIVTTIAPNDFAAIDNAERNSGYSRWPYYSVIDKRPGILHRISVLGVESPSRGKQLRVTVEIQNPKAIPDHLCDWQLRIDPYMGK